KRGHAGTTRWAWYAEAGQVKDANDYPSQYAIWGRDSATTGTNAGKLKRCVLPTVADKSCLPDSTTNFNLLKTEGFTPITTGHRDEYGMNASGGSEQVRFFVSGALENEIGPLKMPDFGVKFFDSLK